MISLDPLTILAVVFIAILVLVLAGLRLAFALMVVGVMSLWIFPPFPLIQQAAEVGWVQLNSFVLTAMPLFLFMGQILSRAGISEQLYRSTEMFISRLPGGLANANIVSASIFAALCGSSVATCAGLGAVAIPAMDSRGYYPRLTLGSLAAGATLGILIPPSISMILYGYLANVSIGDLFIAGIIPGILMALAFMAYIVIWSLKSPSIAPRFAQHPRWRERLNSIMGALPSIVLIIAVVGSIYIGVATPTEAAAVGAFGALVISFFRRRLSGTMLNESLRETAYSTAMVGLVIASAMIVAWALHALRVPIILSETVAESGLNRYLALSLIIFMLYMLGAFIDGISILLLLTPILTPIITALGFDLVWFGVVFTITIEVGLITPPVGMNLFILKSISSDATMEDLIAGASPYVIIMTVVLVALTIWPQLATWLPTMMSGS